MVPAAKEASSKTKKKLMLSNVKTKVAELTKQKM
jgi:hypothetical protein